MTANELRDEFAKFAFGQWPATYEVDADTYANVCQEIFTKQCNEKDGPWITIAVGPHRDGIMFRNVELILKS